jgi:hypothetical protein
MTDRFEDQVVTRAAKKSSIACVSPRASSC